MNKQSRFGLIFVILFLLPFAGVGALCLLKACKIISATWFQSTPQAEWVIGLIFSFLGFGGLFLVIRGISRVVAIDKLHEQHPKEPWLQRPEWVSRRIVSNNKLQMGFFCVFSLVWNGFSWPFMIPLLRQEYARGNFKALVALVFPIAGMFLLWKAVRATLRWLKFGDSVFMPETMPGVVGLELKGAIDVARKFPTDAGFQLKLVCIHKTQSGSGKNSSTWEKIVWQEEQSHVFPQAAYDPNRWSIPVNFSIPLDTPGTSIENHRDQIFWRLEVNCGVSGIDYEAQFDVPVFVTEATLKIPAASTAATPLVAYEHQADAEVKVSVGAEGEKVFYFPHFRHTGAAGLLWVFTLIFGASTVFWSVVGAPVLILLICGLITALCSLFAVSLTLGFTRVVIRGGQAQIFQGILSRTLKTTTVHGNEVRNAQLKVGMQVNRKPFYDIQLVLTNGRKITAGGTLANKREAEWVAAEMSRLLNIPQK